MTFIFQFSISCLCYYLCLKGINGYYKIDLSREGDLNINLPGGSNDVRNSQKLPNMPFTTATNRFSDGITSSASFDITSPHFPFYHGAQANVSERYLHFTKYMESAAEQGIAGYGASEAQQENARIVITSLASYQDLPKPQKNFSVYAAIKWNPSDFAIQEGEYYRVEVLGSQNGFSNQLWYDGGIRANAQGYESFYDAISNCHVGLGRCRSHLRKKRRLLTSNWMSLVCSVGEFVRQLQEIEPGKEKLAKWLPLDEAIVQATLFHVGQATEFRAINSGQLICFANDAHTEYWNNAGLLTVTATRLSWPPEPSTYYRQRYLPACDSAQVVYANQRRPGAACNPSGGGAGWSPADVESNSTRYDSGAPADLLTD